MAENARRARRGSSFVEVLLAMTIMALVLVGILQMFSVSLIVNKGAAARTQMLFKCQQVVENIRWYYYVTSRSYAVPANTGILPLGAMTVNLPYTGIEAEYAFWGPDGANVIERANGPYKISYRIENDAAQTLNSGVAVWVITVSAVPTDVAGAARYLGIGTNGGGKRVDYVAQFTQ
ncbi:MAG: prepilin-type N-terminal cleavage/methylation domain-containing protein [Acidobacteriota bacterium]